MFPLTTQILNYILKLSLAFCYNLKYFQLENIKKKISYCLYSLQVVFVVCWIQQSSSQGQQLS